MLLRSRTHRRAVVATGVVLTAALLASCSSGDTEPAPGESSASTRTTLTYATGDAEPTCLDPHVGGNYPQALISTQFLEALVSRDEAGEIIPWLATEWSTSEDQLTWEFSLRPDVTFTDGTAFTAESVKASIEHVQDPDTGSSTGYLAMEKVDEVEVVDDLTARFHLSEPDSALLESLSQQWVAIQSETALERPLEENCLSPVGTGPFEVTEWRQQDRVILTRNENYSSAPEDATNRGPVALETVEWRFIPDSATRYAALVSGEVDVIDNAQPDTIVSAEGTDTISHLDAPRPGASNRIEFNSSQAPFDDQRVREAFIRAVDVDAAVESLFFDTTERSTSALSSAEPAAVSLPDAYARDVDEANALLDEAGWSERDGEGYRTKDGERLSLDFPVSTNQSVPAEQSLFEQLQAAARDVGIEVNISLLDLGAWYEALATNNYDLVSAPYTKVGPDVLRFLYHSDGTVPAPSGYFANHAQVKLPELDALLEEAVAQTDAEARTALYDEAQRILADGSYILPIYDQQNHYLYRNEVEGFRALPTVSTPTFVDVTVG